MTPMLRYIFAPIAALCFSVGASSQDSREQPSQDATVIFFTPGGHWRGASSHLKTLAYGNADIMSFGEVFDGKDWLASLPHSRYAQFHMAAGSHTFSTGQDRKHPNPKETLPLDLKAGTTTYLAVTATMMNYAAGFYVKMTSHIEPATCKEFAEANSDHALEEIEEKKVAKSALARWQRSAPITPCAP